MLEQPGTGGSPSGSRVRVGLVGLGYWGPNLLRNFVESPQFEVAYLCDTRPELLDRFRRSYPGAVFTTRMEEALDDPELEAVAIATPVSTHHALVSAALDAGKHVFVEKPLARSTDEIVELMDQAEATGRVLMPGHTFLYSPPVREIKRIIDSGELGDIYFISSSRVNLGPVRHDVDVVWDLGPHDFSILRYWLGSVPDEVSAISRSCLRPDLSDVCFVNLRYGSGIVAHVELSWLSPSKLRRTTVVGSKKMVVYDDTSIEPVRVFDSGVNMPDPKTFGEFRLSLRTGDILSPRLEATEPLALQLADFGAAIREGKPLVSSAEVGLDVVRTVEAVARSLAIGGMPVRLPSASSEPLDAPLETGEVAPEAIADDEEEDPVARSETIGTAILGGGPAGLTAAYVFGRRGRPATVFEADGTIGGISKTVEFNGYRFDLGGHRFFTKLQPIQQLWHEMLGSEFLVRSRLSRIYYNGKFFSYPLRARDVVGRLGLVESTRCAMSYLWASRHRDKDADTFEEWVTTRFGRRLYDAFFRSYTEKVWGIPGSEIRSLWAAQRIKNFSMGKAILSMLGLQRDHVTTLIEEFHYPRLGPGQMWDAVAARAEELGVRIHRKERCVSVKHEGNRIRSIVTRENGHTLGYEVDSVISSIALKDLVLALDPPAPPDVRAAAHELRYRDLVLVALMTTEENPFPDNWIYLHDPQVRAGRVQNYGAWSPSMVRPGTTCLGVEYFCFHGDDVWEMSDDKAVEMATEELARLGLIDPSKVVDGVKVLVPKAYPMYDSNFESAVATLREYLSRFENLQTCGRNGLHRYNNQDHSMWTAMLAALNIIEGSEHDVWSVNTEADYHEEGALIETLFDLSAGDAAPVETVI